jgi:hypothetical protein
LARSRARVSRDLQGLRYELDIPRKIRRSFQEQTLVWVAGAALLGTVLVMLPRARKKIVTVDATGSHKQKNKLIETGFLLGALKIAATLLRPALLGFIRQKMTGGGDSSRAASKW